ncbi:MAG: hypothetical protein MMC33_010582 [Icmadophila ericetorum]|nr:hypothetical protein [Icmadophila ericetorum]
MPRYTRAQRAQQALASEQAAAASFPDPKSPSPIFFWREHAKNGFLSQWYHSPFYSETLRKTFTCAEQAYMYSKAIYFGDQAIATAIMNAETPGKQKVLGRMVEGFDEKRWDAVKFEIVVQGSRDKFTQTVDLEERERLKRMLLNTRGRELVEASPSDRIWGIGFAAEVAEGQRANWGQNLLGKALMTARARLREERDGIEDAAEEKGEKNHGIQEERS